MKLNLSFFEKLGVLIRIKTIIAGMVVVAVIFTAILILEQIILWIIVGIITMFLLILGSLLWASLQVFYVWKDEDD